MTVYKPTPCTIYIKWGSNAFRPVAGSSSGSTKCYTKASYTYMSVMHANYTKVSNINTIPLPTTVLKWKYKCSHYKLKTYIQLCTMWLESHNSRHIMWFYYISYASRTLKHYSNLGNINYTCTIPKCFCGLILSPFLWINCISRWGEVLLVWCRRAHYITLTGHHPNGKYN